MNKSLTLALAIATTFTTFGIGGAVMAQDRLERGGDITRADAEARAERQFTRMDANDDGVISEADREARQRARFDRADADGDGAISFDEFTAIRENRAERRNERRGERAERRGRRGGERMAMRGHRRGGQGGPGLAGLLRQNADSDGDGAINQAEFTAAALTRFERQDSDGDGTVTADERRSHREAMRAVRQAHRAQNAE